MHLSVVAYLMCFFLQQSLKRPADDDDDIPLVIIHFLSLSLIHV